MMASVQGSNPNERIKEVVEERIDEQGRQVRVTRRIVMRLVTTKVSAAVARRRQWAKFGDAKDDGPGPNLSSTLISEPVFLRLSIDGRVQEVGTSVKGSVVAAKSVVCRYCQGGHWSAKCPYKSTFANEVSKEAAAEADAAAQPLKYVPPSVRRAMEMAATSGTSFAGVSLTGRDNPFTVRISNLPDITTEDDIRDLVSRIATVSRVYLSRDYVTGLCRGMSFVSFTSENECQRVIKRIHGLPYGNLILHADMAKPQAPL